MIKNPNSWLARKTLIVFVLFHDWDSSLSLGKVDFGLDTRASASLFCRCVAYAFPRILGMIGMLAGLSWRQIPFLMLCWYIAWTWITHGSEIRFWSYRLFAVWPCWCSHVLWFGPTFPVQIEPFLWQRVGPLLPCGFCCCQCWHHWCKETLLKSYWNLCPVFFCSAPVVFVF